MADNTQLNTNTTSGDVIASDEISSVKYQRVKLIHGADGVNAGDVAAANGLPVQPATGASWAVTMAAVPTGGATAANQATEISSLASIDGKIPALGQALAAASVPVVLTAAQLSTLTPTAGLTDAQLRASAVPVSGTFYQATQPVSVATIPSHDVTNAGTFATQATQAGTWNVGMVTTVTTVSAVTAITNALPAGTNNIGDVDVLTVPADPFGANADAASATGSISAKLRFIAATGIPITGTVTVGSHAVTNAGTFAVQAAQSGTWTVTGAGGSFPVTDSDGSLTVDAPVATPVFVRLSDGAAAITTLAVSLASVPSHAVTNAGTFAVQAASAGDVAHDAADSGNPIKIGAKVETSPKGITLVADGGRTNVYADADGQLIVKLGTSGADAISESVSDTGGTSTAFSNFTAVASTKNAITAYSIFRTDAGTTMAYVDFRDGTGGAVLWRVPLPPSGGANLSLGGQPIFKTSANTALAYDVSAALTTVYISVSGFQTKV